MTSWSRSRWLLVPFLIFVGFSWWKHAFSYVADDSYFYLVIARNIATQGHQTFSGIYPTNGFHPLWQYLLAGYTFVAWKINPAWIHQLHYAVPLSIALVAFGACQFYKVADKLNLNPLWLVYLPLGYLTLFGVLYSEAHAFYAALGLLARLSFSATPSRKFGPFFLGLAGALVFLARLDSITLLACYGIWLLWITRRFSAGVLFSVGFCLLAVPYLWANLHWFAMPEPVSGWMKSSFPHVGFRSFYNHGLGTTFLGYNLLFGVAPILLGAMVLQRSRRANAQARGFTLVLWAGSVLHFVYVALFTRFATDWYWYYVQPMVLLGFVAALMCQALDAREPRRAQDSTGGFRLPTAAIAVILALAFTSITLKSRWKQSHASATDIYYFNYLQDHHIQSATLLMEDGPGLVAYYTNNNVISADMLTGNHRLYEQMLSSGDALQFLKAHARAQGKPIRLILYGNAGNFMKPDADYRGVTLDDPRAYPAWKPIGHLNLNAPASRSSTSGDRDSAIWELAD